MNSKEIILHLFENKRHRKLLLELFNKKLSFTELKRRGDIHSSTTLTRALDYFDSVGLVINIFERTKEKSYSYYELSHYGRRIAQIVEDLENEIDSKIDEIIPA